MKNKLYTIFFFMFIFLASAFAFSQDVKPRSVNASELVDINELNSIRDILENEVPDLTAPLAIAEQKTSILSLIDIGQIPLNEKIIIIVLASCFIIICILYFFTRFAKKLNEKSIDQK